MIYRTINKVITNTISEPRKRYSLTYQIVATAELKLLRLSMRPYQSFGGDGDENYLS